MKRRLIAGAAALALFATTASPAFADQGAPGSTFPDQPGTHTATGCAAIFGNPGQGPARDSLVAYAIQIALFTDACT
jgi:hypothetical protein